MLKFLFLAIFSILFVACSSENLNSLKSEEKVRFMSISKAPISSEISIFKSITLEFTSDLNLSTINESSAYIEDELGEHVALNLSIGLDDTNKNKIIFTPYKYFLPSHTYTIFVTTAVKSTLGLSLSQDFSSAFTTAYAVSDTTPISFKSIRPLNNSSADPRTDISIEFDKHVAPISLNNQLIKVTRDGKEVNGTIEFYNSVVTFKPLQPLLNDTNCSVELVGLVTDMYGNEYSGDRSWSFQVSDVNNTLKQNDEYELKESKNLNTTASILRVLEDVNNNHIIAVVSKNELLFQELVDDANGTTSLGNTLYRHSVTSKINTIEVLDKEYLLVGTQSDGIFILRVSKTAVETVSHVTSLDPIFDFSLGENSAGVVDRVYAAGPQYGLEIFSLAADKTLTSLKKVSSGTALVSVDTSGKKIYAAEYDVGVRVFDENATLISTISLEGLTKSVTVLKDDTGIARGLLAISSRGVVTSVNLDGTINTAGYLNLLSVADNISINQDLVTGSRVYISDPSNGLLIVNSDTIAPVIDSILAIDEAIVSSDLINYSTNQYLLTLDKSGKVSLFLATNLSVNSPNSAPVAVDDNLSVSEDSNETVIDILSNDTDLDADTLAVSFITQPLNGISTLTGSVVGYVPNANYNGVDSFTYTVNDGNLSSTATVYVTVNSVNDAPVAQNDIQSLNEDSNATVINVTSNDTDIDGDALSVISVTQASNGTVTLTSGIITYIPNTNFHGIDSFTYTISDGSLSSTVTVNLTVNSVADAPSAVDDNVSTSEDTSLNITQADMLSNDFDVDGDAFSIVNNTIPVNGTIEFDGNSTYYYSPNTNYNGIDTFTYTISDGNLSTTATVNITVNSVNDVPAALDDNITAYSNIQLIIDSANLLANDSDGDADSLTISSFTQPQNGIFTDNNDSTYTYLSSVDYFGTDSFTYTISDGNGGTAEANVSITVAQSWSQIRAGLNHTVAIKSDGTLWSWGDNLHGQLGDTNTTGSLVPVQESTGSNWMSVAAGSKHTAAVKNDGTLWSWGYGYDGQLGDGNITSSSVPVQESTNSANWISLCTGESHTVALKNDGTLWSWGSNNYGQLGDGNITNSSVPVQEITYDINWSSVSCGSNHTVALKNDGTLWSWGRNTSGELGDGTFADKYTPVQENSSSVWNNVIAGSNFSVAVKNDGTLWSWGSNTYGQLGNSSYTNSSSPIQESTTSTWNNIGAGSFHALAIKSDGTLWSWGQNSYGQLGDSTTTGSNVPVQESTLSTWKKITAGGLQSFAIKSDGTFYSWGHNMFGELGNGSTSNSSSPTQEGSASIWSSLAAGESHSVAIKSDGTLWSWGANTFGQLGTGDDVNTSLPSQESTISSWTTLKAGKSHTVAIKSDGTLWAWGNGSSGQLGDGNYTSSSVPLQIDASNTWSSVIAGDYHTLALKSGSLWAWGNGSSGQLGDGNYTSSSIPIQIDLNSTWIGIAAGSLHTAAIKSDGTLWTWGSNSYGQLGDVNSSGGSTLPVQEDTNSTNWSSVVSGSSHNLALRSDGTLWSWGANSFGQLGDANTTNRYIPTQIAVGSTWTDIAAGEFYSAAIKSDGTLWSWGENLHGQFGNGTTNGSLIPVQEDTNATDWVSVEIGDDHSVALKSDGTLWSWGENSGGQLGHGVFTPTQITNYK